MVGTVKSQIANLQPNIQDLQADACDLLKDISKLMNRAKNDLSIDNSGEKYGEFQKSVEAAINTVENLELRMAIVAPMKAGKSTIINAIVGQDLLPSRNAAMTTIPTKISLNNEIKEPQLILDKDTLTVLKNSWQNLQQEINTLGKKRTKERINQYPHLLDLTTEIQNNNFKIDSEIVGKDKISLVLTKLNDLVRLCSQLDPNNDPNRKITRCSLY